MPYHFYKLKENQKEAGEYPNWTTSDGEIPATAHHVSVFSLSAKPIEGDDAHNSKIRFKGDFIAEIDGKNLDHAIREALLIKKFLISANVDLSSCQIFISGNKGFHVVIPFECFGGFATPDLPQIFKKIAISIAQETGMTSLDHAMFNGGGTPFKLPQSLRQPNMRRANGHYKVQISWDELDEITSQNYFERCAAPRDLITLAAKQENRKLMDLYSAAVCELRDEADQDRFAPFENTDFEVLNGEIPPCFKQLMAYKNINSENGGWNNSKRTAARGYASDVIGDAELALIAQNFQSTRNPTPAGRLAELKTLSASFTKSGKGFGCGYALQILDKNPCKGCPIKPICAKKQTELNLINKVSSSPKHISALIKAIKTAIGDTKTKLGRTLCKSLAKGTPARRSIDDSIAIAVANGVDEGLAREVIEGDVTRRANQMRSANKITNFEGLQRVNVDGLSHDEIADRILQEIDLERYFAMLLGETEVVEALAHDAYEHDDGRVEYFTYTENVTRPVTMKPKVFLMNLPMAMGKTTVATRVYSSIQVKLYAKFLEYKATFPKREGNKLHPLSYAIAATITAHRTSLIKGLSERFNVANYQLIENKRDFVGSFATCIDSLSQFKIRNSLLIVDEAKQTLEHLATAETIGSSDKNQGGRRALYDHFKACYETAIFTILMDADLDDLTVDWFKQNGAGREFILLEMTEQAHPANHTILTGGHDEARHKILELLKQGRRGVVACTSEKQALMTTKWLKKQGVKRILIITGENKGNSRQAAFLNKVSMEWDNYEVIVHSPVIGSGVSIENPNLDFSVMLNTCVVPANEAWQMLGRNRCAKDIFISFDKASNTDRVTDFEVFIEAEKERIAENHFAELNNGGFEITQTVKEFTETVKPTALTHLQAKITAKRNADLNDYANNMIVLGALQNRHFEYSRNESKTFEIKGLRDEVISEIAENRLNANQIDAATVEAYNLETALTQEQSNELNRHRVCEMAGTDEITREDVENHLDGAFSVVTAVETLLKPENELQVIDAANRKTLNKSISKVKEQRIFNEIFATLSDQTFGNFFNDKDANVCVNQETALKICKILKKHHKELSWRADYSKIPKDAVRRANSYLKKYGFKGTKSSENKERNYMLFFDEKIALYVNNRAALVNSS